MQVPRTGEAWGYHPAMSITRLAVIRCDSCGAETKVDGDNTIARVRASREGWKFMSYQGLDIRGDPKMRSRQWDACPACPLPEPAEVIKAILAEREVTANSG